MRKAHTAQCVDSENPECTCPDADFDEVERPAHYNRGAIEVRDFIHDQKLNFNRGNVVKYVCRAGFKRAPDGYEVPELRDLQKARDYLDHEIEQMSADEPHTPDLEPKGPMISTKQADMRVRKAAADAWELAARYLEDSEDTLSEDIREFRAIAAALRGPTHL